MRIVGNAPSGGKKPTTPTIGTATAGNASATVAFTPPTYTGKGGTVTYVATSSPGGFTGSSTSSPITVSGLSNGTAYTFTVVAQTNYGVNSDASAASNSVTPVVPVYTLAATFNESGAYTVPSSGVSKIAVIVVSAGIAGTAGTGGNSNTYVSGKGGNGGRSGSGVGFKDYSVSPNSTFNVTVGSTSSFGSLATASSTASSNVGGAVVSNSTSGGNGGASRSANTTGGGQGFAGNAGTANNTAINLSNANIPSFSFGGGGGGGGGGALLDTSNTNTAAAGSAGGGSSPYGSAGGAGGSANYNIKNDVVTQNAGLNGSTPGGAGGGSGGGGGGAAVISYTGSTAAGNAQSPGPGRVFVYTQ